MEKGNRNSGTSCGKASILVVCQYYYPENFQITPICEALADDGYKVTVLTGMDTGKNTETVSILYDAMRPGGRMDLFVLL